ncbi:hypothetical protein [Sphingopyxis sp. YF1]|uniref:hypothetical protein n=1 Tax=Sphingopyxis sp. YF1 TaxID=2482763 RepID=UPI001F62076C|nr:hypothetical protein [Sphingopyxis sp. YF1]
MKYNGKLPTQDGFESTKTSFAQIFQSIAKVTAKMEAMFGQGGSARTAVDCAAADSRGTADFAAKGRRDSAH